MLSGWSRNAGSKIVLMLAKRPTVRNTARAVAPLPNTSEPGSLTSVGQLEARAPADRASDRSGSRARCGRRASPRAWCAASAARPAAPRRPAESVGFSSAASWYSSDRLLVALEAGEPAAARRRDPARRAASRARATCARRRSPGWPARPSCTRRRRGRSPAPARPRAPRLHARRCVAQPADERQQRERHERGAASQRGPAVMTSTPFGILKANTLSASPVFSR